MKNVFTILSHVFLFFILVQYDVFGQENISYIKCEQSACSIQNPFYEYKNVTAKLKGKCTNEFVSGKYFVSFYSNGILICQYDGDIIDGKLTGNGKITYLSKDWPEVLWKSKIYEGGWENGKYHGQGTLTLINKDKTQHTLTGKWANGNLEGIGTEIKPNGDTYIGNFSKGNYYGNGKLTYANGEYYEGEFADGLQSGYGFKHTMSGDFDGYFANGMYIGKRLPVWLNDTIVSAINKSTIPFTFSKVTFININQGARCSFDPTSSTITYGERDRSKKIGLENFEVKDTVLTDDDMQRSVTYSRGGNYYLNSLPGTIKIFKTADNKEIASINHERGQKIFDYSRKTAISSSFSKFAMIDYAGKEAENGSIISVYLLTDKLPLLYQKVMPLIVGYNIFFTKNDRYLGVTQRKNIDFFDPISLEKKFTIEYIRDHSWDELVYLWDDEKNFIFKFKQFKEISQGVHQDSSYLLFYKLKDGKLTHEKDFPSPDKRIIYRDVKLSTIDKAKNGDYIHGSTKANALYDADTYYIFKDYIAVKYKVRGRGDGYCPFRLFEMATGKQLFDLTIHDSSIGSDFIPNKDCSAFMVQQKGSTDLSNFEGYMKFVLYNTSDTLSKTIKQIDLKPTETKKEYDRYANQPIIKAQYEQFNKDVKLTDTLFYVVNSNDGKNFAEWINANSSDMITWDKANIFTGGIITNNGKSPYKVKITTYNRYLKTVSALWISNNTSEVDGGKRSISLLLNPGESKQFLFCERNVEWGYYSKGSGTGVRYRLNSVPYNLKIHLSNDSISSEDERNQKALIQEFVANNYNLKQTHKGFAESILGVKSEINVFCKLGNKEDKISINIFSSDNRLLDESVVKKEYGSGATSFSSFKQENTTYKVVVSVVGVLGSDRSYSVTTKPGLTQLFIENDGNSRIEYRTK